MISKKSSAANSQKLVNPEPEVEDATILEAQTINTDEEFGFDDDD